ncbi:plasmid partitioning protein, partial [Streptomyces flaveolus]
RIGEEPIDLLRAVGNKPAAQQATALEELKTERARKDERARSERPARKAEPADASTSGSSSGQGGDYAVITSPAPADSSPGGTPAPGDVIPEPRADAASQGTPHEDTFDQHARKVPYDQPGALAMLLDHKVPSDDHFFDLLRLLSMKALERDAARLDTLARSLLELARSRGE